jgi:hypothetical protein
VPDLVADVMVVAKATVGRFGGALRRLIYSTAALPPVTIAAAQALTEQVTQRVLSVKAGKPPIPFGEYERQLRRLLGGEAVLPSDNEEMQALLEQAKAVCEALQEAMCAERPAWVDWLRTPYELADRVAEAGDGGLRLPLGDARLAGWVEFTHDLQGAGGLIREAGR